VHRALTNQSGMLISTLTNLLKNVVGGSVTQEPMRGPSYFNMDPSASGSKGKGPHDGGAPVLLRIPQSIPLNIDP
jgi:hypothetical protein